MDKMTPFKIKVTVEHYERMGYNLKVKDVLHLKRKDGNYVQYVELIGRDQSQNVWLGKTPTLKSVPVSLVDAYIEIVVIPFEQYTRKLNDRATIKK